MVRANNLEQLVKLMLKKQGLTLIKSEEFELEFQERSLFLDVLKEKLLCSDESINRIRQKIPIRSILKKDIYAKGIGYEEIYLESEDILWGYEVRRVTLRTLYPNGNTVVSEMDDSTHSPSLIHVDLEEVMTAEDYKRISQDESSHTVLADHLSDNGYSVELNGGIFSTDNRECEKLLAIPIYDHVKMQKYVSLQHMRINHDYFFRFYADSKNECKIQWKLSKANFIVEKSKNINQIKLGMDEDAVDTLLESPVIGEYFREIYNVKYYWVHEQKMFGEYFQPIVFKQKGGTNKLPAHSYDYDYIVAGIGWDALNKILG